MDNKTQTRNSVIAHLETFKDFGVREVLVKPLQKIPPPVSSGLTETTSLEDLRTFIGDCTRCKLCKTRKNIVFGVGNPKAELMFVGEGPGADEDEQGEPFVGRAGQLLTKIIQAMGFERKDIYIANTVKCLRYNSMVQLEDGSWERIGRLVRNKYDARVMSVESNGVIAPKRVTGWHETPLAGRGVYKLSFKTAKKNNNGKSVTFLTEDHPVLTKQGYVEVQYLTDEHEIATGQGFSPVVKNLIYGTLLGDGNIARKNANLSFSHSEKQASYANFKTEILKQDLEVSFFEMKVAAGGDQKYPIVRSITQAHRAFWYIREEFYGPKKKVPSHLANNLNPMILAFWFMDDGYLRIRPPRQSSSEIATCAFEPSDVEILIKGLCKLGIEGYTRQGRIFFDVNASKKLSEVIAPYVHPSMRYKLHSEIALRIPFNPALFKQQPKETMYDQIEVSPVKFTGTDKTFFCIDVEGTNNFVTAGGVVHNCRPPENRNPELDELAMCMPFLKQQIQIIKPKVIMCLGKFAAQTVLDTQIPISRLRGEFRDVDGIAVMPTFHPAYLLRNPAMKKPMWEDCKKVMEKLKSTINTII